MTRGGTALIVAALLVQAFAVRAAPLDKDGCAKLKAEQGQLEQGGARGDMGRGPEWAKANLAPAKLEHIRRLIELDEQLLFRCQGRPLVNLKETDPSPKAPDAKAAKAPNGERTKAPNGERKSAAPVKKAAAPPADAAAKAAVKAPPAAKPAATPASPAPAKAAKAGEDKKVSAAKTKSKRKSDDAYRPPPADWGTNPFADQLAPAAKK
jgi:hypothetical protein